MPRRRRELVCPPRSGVGSTRPTGERQQCVDRPPTTASLPSQNAPSECQPKAACSRTPLFLRAGVPAPQ
eukprot:15975691-Heterocapsa_arctica.AAC.1